MTQPTLTWTLMLDKHGSASGLHLVTLVNLGFGDEHDVTPRANVDRYLARAQSGYYDGGHVWPPCALWSQVRFVPGGPPPRRRADSVYLVPGDHALGLARALRLQLVLQSCLTSDQLGG